MEQVSGLDAALPLNGREVGKHEELGEGEESEEKALNKRRNIAGVGEERENRIDEGVDDTVEPVREKQGKSYKDLSHLV